MAGYFQVDRSLAQAFLPKHGTRYSELEAYIFLTSFAAYAPREESVGAKLVALDVGDLVASERYLQSRWGWSRTKIRSFKEILKSRGLVSERKDQGETILNVTFIRDRDDIPIPKKTTFNTKGEPPKDQGETNIIIKKKEEGTTPVATHAIAWSATDGWAGISEKDQSAWKEAYPACDIKRQLASMNQWLLSNPSKAKKKQWRRFITNWLNRTQERGGDIKSNPSQAPKTNYAKQL